MLSTLISPGYFLINAHLRHIAPNFHNHFPISVILPFILQSPRCQVDKTIWITSHITSYSSCKLQLKPTGKIMIRNLRSSEKTSQKWSHQLWVRLKFINPHQTRRIHKRLRILSLWYRLTRGFHHYKVDILQKYVACGISNIRWAHQNYMNSSSRHKSKLTLIWTSRTSTNT